MSQKLANQALEKHECPNHELARLASVLAMPPHLREHDTSGDQLPRHFPREQVILIEDKKESVISDAAKGSGLKIKTDKTRTIGLPAKLWQPMKGEFTVNKRIAEIDQAIELLEAEKRRLRK